MAVMLCLGYMYILLKQEICSDNNAVFGSFGCQISEYSLKSGFVQVIDDLNHTFFLIQFSFFFCQSFVCYSPVKHFVVTPSELLASYADCSVGIWNRHK